MRTRIEIVLALGVFMRPGQSTHLAVLFDAAKITEPLKEVTSDEIEKSPAGMTPVFPSAEYLASKLSPLTAKTIAIMTSSLR